ncbi:hypothetical protein QBC47DRAFT_423793 [Echria macrotheca]|uniref:Protein kinase domain-containing protein n=1 Tax=Echria macrotheca TaxID=438768 RepID=A0AAJ0B957_9PEZI|nr:hypothetical protein QBC47DRAFT_423793 [Echria macrotheca]
MPYDAPFYQTCCGDEDDDTALSRPHYARQAEAARATTIPRFSSEEELERNLKPHLPELEQALRQTRPLGDSVFPLVAELLAQHGKGEWSLRPRTFAVLKILGCPELLDDFVKEGRYDSALPYTDGNLPSAVKGSTLRNKFLKLQALVACQESDIAALEEGGKHLHLLRPGDEYFRDRRSLGGGRQGIVESVVSLRSARPFVRKCFSRGLSVLLDSTVLREFEAELNSLKRLCHDHIVKLVGSYTDSDTVGIVMTPVADCDLEEFLRNAATDPISPAQRH